MTRRSVRPALLFLLLLAFGLRVYQLGTQELRGDEAFGYFFSLRGYGEIVAATVDLQEPHPPLSYWLQRAWLMLLGADGAGHSETALRFVSVWFGTLIPALIYRLARALTLAPISGLLAVLPATVSPYLIWHAQDARMYSISTALTLAATLAMVAWLRRPGGVRQWLWAGTYVLLALCALLVHYFAFFVLATHYLFVVGQGILDRHYRWSILPWIGMQTLVGILYLPWLYQAAETLVGYGGNGDSPVLAEAVRRTLAAVAAGESFVGRPQGFLAMVAFLLLAIGVGRLLGRGERQTSTAVLLLLYLGVPIVATWLGARQRPIFDARYLAAASPPFFPLAGAAVGEAAAQGWRRGRGLLLTSVTLYVILLLSALIGLNRQFSDAAYSKTRGWRDLAATVNRLSLGLEPEQVRIAQNFPDPTLWYYYDGNIDHVVLPPAPQDEAAAIETARDLRDANVSRVILPRQPAPAWDPGGIADGALVEAGYLAAGEEQVGVWPVVLYAAPGRETTAPPANAEFGEVVTLTAISNSVLRLEPGAILTPITRWQAADPARASELKVSLQLIGPDGSLVAQNDLGLGVDAEPQGNDEIRHVHMLPLPAALPAGTYQLFAVVYSASGGDRLLLPDGADRLLLDERRQAEEDAE